MVLPTAPGPCIIYKTYLVKEFIIKYYKTKIPTGTGHFSECPNAIKIMLP